MTPTLLKRFVALELVILVMAPASQAFAGRPSSAVLTQVDGAASAKAGAQEDALQRSALRAVEMLPPLQAGDLDDDTCNSAEVPTLVADLSAGTRTGNIELTNGTPYDNDWVRVSGDADGLVRVWSGGAGERGNPRGGER